MSAAFVLSVLWIVWTAYKVWRPPHNPNDQGFIIVPASGVYNKIAAVTEASLFVVLLLVALAFMAERIWPQLARRY
jgi:hypothetical protein